MLITTDNRHCLRILNSDTQLTEICATVSGYYDVYCDI